MHQKQPVAFTSLIMCHSLIERSQFCSEHRELLLLLGMWVHAVLEMYSCFIYSQPYDSVWMCASCLISEI